MNHNMVSHIQFLTGEKLIVAMSGEETLVKVHMTNTDLRQGEDETDFVVRHGGVIPTINYLNEVVNGKA